MCDLPSVLVTTVCGLDVRRDGEIASARVGVRDHRAERPDLWWGVVTEVPRQRQRRTERILRDCHSFHDMPGCGESHFHPRWFQCLCFRDVERAIARNPAARVPVISTNPAFHDSVVSAVAIPSAVRMEVVEGVRADQRVVAASGSITLGHSDIRDRRVDRLEDSGRGPTDCPEGPTVCSLAEVRYRESHFDRRPGAAAKNPGVAVSLESGRHVGEHRGLHQELLTNHRGVQAVIWRVRRQR